MFVVLILLWLIRIDKSLRFLKQITNKTGRNMMSREKMMLVKYFLQYKSPFEVIGTCFDISYRCVNEYYQCHVYNNIYVSYKIV